MANKVNEICDSDHQREVELAAYTDRLSGRPGDTIRFMVSSQNPIHRVRARLNRSICSDPNPQGPGIVESDASEWFRPLEFASSHQPICAGSYAKSEDKICVNKVQTLIKIDIWIFPTLVSSKNCTDQYIWSFGESPSMALFLNTDGFLVVRSSSITASNRSIVLSEKLKANKWYNCSLTTDFDQSTLDVMVQQNITTKTKPTKLSTMQTSQLTLSSVGPINEFFYLAYGGSFNGKIEDPKILVDNMIHSAWDFSENISGWSIPSSSIAIASTPIILFNHPTRAVKGRLWDGAEFCWKHKPSHYAAIYFHDDDIYDFDWEPSFEWKIPKSTPSGIYVMRMSSNSGGNLYEEALPLFICAPKEKGDAVTAKKLCILVSTFTYVMYGNHSRPDFRPSWVTALRDEWKGAYLNYPSQFPKYGYSTYNYHSDGSAGIVFGSHKRPLFNLRPGYATFGTSTKCSGLRHFPADSHLIAWMHHFNYDYDIITDHELHREGFSSLSRYNTLVTGTHPEYHTMESLNALQEFRNNGGNLMYLGGNGFYWRVASQGKDASLLEIRRSEDGVRTWASEPGEYYHALDGTYGGLWRRNLRPPQQLVGVGFAAQGTFDGSKPYKRVCFDPRMHWVFAGIDDEILLGNFGYSGGGAAGFELDRVDRNLDGGDDEIFILCQSFGEKKQFMLVPEEVLTPWQNTARTTNDSARRADMIYLYDKLTKSQIFSVGSISFCGSLPWNNFENNISTLLRNVLEHFIKNNGVSE